MLRKIFLLVLFVALIRVSPDFAVSNSVAADLSRLPQLEVVITDSLALPSTGVRGLAFSKSYMWMLISQNEGVAIPDSNYESFIYEFNRETGQRTLLTSEKDSYESGLAYDGTFLWSSGARIGQLEAIYQIQLVDEETLQKIDASILNSLPAFAYHPAGLAFDGKYLWQSDADARKLARIEIEEGRVSRKIASPALYPSGLAYDGFHFWTADVSTGRIYRLKGHNGRADGVLSEDAFYRPGEFISLASDGRALWAVSASDSFAVRLEVLQ